MQYFVVLIDYGFQDGAHRGMEAIVKPEATRRQIIEEVRDVMSCDHRTLVHVKEIDGNYCEDVTADICAEVEQLEMA